MFDAMRVLPAQRVDDEPEGEEPEEPIDDTPIDEPSDDSQVLAMCSATGRSGGLQFLFVLLALVWLRSRSTAR